MDRKIQAEVDADFEVLQKMLPDLLGRESKRRAPMRRCSGECAGFFDTLRVSRATRGMRVASSRYRK